MDSSNPRYGPLPDIYQKRHSQQNHSNEQVQSRAQTETFNHGKMGPPASIPIDPSLVTWSQNHRPAYFPQGGLSNQAPRIEHRLQERSLLSDNPGGLDAIPIGVLEPRTGDLESNPLVRFWRDDGPWYPPGLGVGGLGQSPALPQHAVSHERSKRSHPSHGQYGNLVGTTLEGRFLRGQLSDSGYGTQSHVTGSVFSRDYEDQIPESQSLVSDTDRAHRRLENAPRDYLHEAPEEAQPLPFDSCSNDSREPGTLIPLICDHPDCGAKLKNQSEYRKHRQRHEKLHVCQERDCTRRQKGFSTKNDLERHKKSVHKISPTNLADKSFQCKGLNCTKRDKVWPRLDNFRSHGRRVHKDEDLEDLVRMSEIDNNVTPIHGEVSYQARSHPAGSACSPKDVNENHEGSLQELERVHSRKHALQEGVSEPVMPHTSTSKTAQLPMIAPFDGMNHAIDSGLDIDDARHSKGSRHLTEKGYSMHSPLIETSAQSALEANGFTLSRNASQQDVAPCQSRTNNAATNISESTPSSRVHIPSAGRQVSGRQVEQLSKAIAADINKHMNQPLSEEMQNIIRGRVLSILDQSGPSKRTIEDAGFDGSPEPPGKRVACSICPKTMGRPCDIKKHEKRHRRPYGCTHATCTKAFGSKNDWKRHENSQHYQLETWRCHEPNPRSKINQCARIFYRRDPFHAHLRKDHNVTDEEYIRDQCKRRRIGRNGQSGFWCGFCKAIVKLEKRGLEAWDERFNHIDDEHFKRDQHIEDWYPPDKDIPKRLLRMENILDSGGLSTTLDESEDEGSDGEAACNGSNATRITVRQKLHGNTLAHTTLPWAPRQRETPSNVDNANVMEQSSRSNKRQKTSTGWEWYCCKCKMGPHNPHLVTSCWGESCNEHQMCTHCSVYEV